MGNFIDRHNREPGFSFMVVASDQSKNYEFYLGDSKDGKTVTIWDFHFLFPPRLQSGKARHFLVYSGEKGLADFPNYEGALQYAGQQRIPLVGLKVQQ